MRTNGNLVSVVMDGIKDTRKLLDYADVALDEGNKQMHDWFKRKAHERFARTQNEWADAETVLKFDESPDGMGKCLKQHITNEMHDITMRM